MVGRLNTFLPLELCLASIALSQEWMNTQLRKKRGSMTENASNTLLSEMGNEKMSTLEVTKKAVRADLMTAFHLPNRSNCIMPVITIETKASVRPFRNSLEESFAKETVIDSPRITSQSGRRVHLRRA
jgi:hypothetical protein